MMTSAPGATIRRLLAISPIELGRRVFREVKADDATHMAAGVAFYAILSLFPLALGILAIFAPLLNTEDVHSELLSFANAFIPGADETLDTFLVVNPGARGLQGIVSLIALFWAASALFGAISRAVNRAWDVHQDRPFYIAKVRHLLMALGVGLLFFSSVTVTAELQFVNILYVSLVEDDAFGGAWLQLVLAHAMLFTLNFGIFVLIFKFVPNTKTYWRFVLPGAAATAFVFELTEIIFIFYETSFADYSRVYGALASIVLLQIWAYVAALVLIVGAEFTSEYGRMVMGVGQGQTIAANDQDQG